VRNDPAGASLREDLGRGDKTGSTSRPVTEESCLVERAKRTSHVKDYWGGHQRREGGREKNMEGAQGGTKSDREGFILGSFTEETHAGKRHGVM